MNKNESEVHFLSLATSNGSEKMFYGLYNPRKMCIEIYEPSRLTAAMDAGYVPEIQYSIGYDGQVVATMEETGLDEDITLGTPDLVERMEEADYKFCFDDCVWQKVVRDTVHTCTRHDHKDGKIKLGDRYWVMVTRCVDSDGKSSHVVTKGRLG